MLLYCVRHGEACRADLDPRCPLTVKGQHEVSAIAEHLAPRNLKISHIIHSGKLRAQQTAAILAAGLGVAHVTESPALLDCEAEVENLLALIQQWTEDTLLVGHLPFMPQLVNALVLGKPHFNTLIYYPPATVVCLERQQDARWIIRWALNPEVIGC